VPSRFGAAGSRACATADKSACPYLRCRTYLVHSQRRRANQSTVARTSMDNPRMACQPSSRTIGKRERRLERETGIEPATNSLEGCDSTTELLPPFDSLRSLRASPRDSVFRQSSLAAQTNSATNFPAGARSTFMRADARKVGGEGRVRTSVARRRQVYSLLRLTALPPPRNTSRTTFRARLPWISAPVSSETVGCCPQACTCHGVRVSDVSLKCGAIRPWSWRRDLNPRPADYKSAALPD
jgi:hypothetical protein